MTSVDKKLCSVISNYISARELQNCIETSSNMTSVDKNSVISNYISARELQNCIETLPT